VQDETSRQSYSSPNPGSAMAVSRRAIDSLRIVWQTELWLDPIERHLTAGGELTSLQSRIVAEELSFSFRHLVKSAEATLDLTRRFVESGAALLAHDQACRFLESLSGKSFFDEFAETRAQIAEVLERHIGFPSEEFASVFDATIGDAADDREAGDLKVERGAIVYESHPCVRFLGTSERAIPRADGRAWITGGLLQNYEVGDTPGADEYDTDIYQALLAITKTVVERYRERVLRAEFSELTPHPAGQDPVVGWFVLLVFAFVALTVITALCAAKSIPKKVCEVLLPVVAAAVAGVAAKTCKEIEKDPKYDNPCNLKGKQLLP
jgi:hypothetical protein